ncbi:MAG TPA: PAS domain-containing protein, partial [Polyangiales bacterium]
AGPLRGPCAFLNRHCRLYVGFGASDPASFDWRACVHAEDRERLELLLVSAEAERDELEAECRLRAEDGVHRWFRLNAVPLSKHGTAPHWVFAGVEIEELRMRRDRLSTDRARLNALLATSPGAIVSYRMRADGSTQMLFVSQAGEQIYGFPPEAIIADANLVTSRLGADSADIAAASIRTSLRDGTPWHAEFRYRHPTEGETWLEAHFVPSGTLEGEPVWNGIVLDITKRKRSEEQLALSQAILETALEATQMGAWVWDPATDKAWANEAQRAMWQFGSDVPTWYPADLARERIHPDDVKRVDELMALAATTGERLDFELRLCLHDGTQRWVASRACAALDPNG